MARSLQACALCAERRDPGSAIDGSARSRRAPLWLAVRVLDACTQAALESLAVWTDRITPLVSLDAPDSLLLEVRGSLKLLGGLDAIKQRLSAELEARALAGHLCAAPTPLAAAWLARHGAADALAPGELAGRLNPLPLSVTRWPEPVLELLEDMGLRSIGDCLRLPREGFARRIGLSYLRDLDGALGRRADPRPGFVAPRSLSRGIEFSYETEDLASFMHAVDELGERMVAELRSLQYQTQSCTLVFHHLDRAATHNELALVEPVHEKHRLVEPLCARLQSIALPAPAIAIELRLDALVPMSVATGELFARAGDDGAAAPRAELIERLRGRFGASDVYGLALVAEHRPEWVWSKRTERLLERGGAGLLSPWAHERPLWLLSPPLPLSAGACLTYRGPVRVTSEAERIESGWWDGADISRDYFTATTAQGERLWVYRDCSTRRWYLHGIFG